MQFYLYSCQDLIISANGFTNLRAGTFYRLELDSDETIVIYSTTNNGSFVITYNILFNRQHNQIIFHQINNSAIICEIKPFVLSENSRQYMLASTSVRLIEGCNGINVLCNGKYYGYIKGEYSVVFEKHKGNDKEYGVIYLKGTNKNIILFNKNEILFCGQYVDSEILNNNINIYRHLPNIFNVGQLIKYDCDSDKFEIKLVQDKGIECKYLNKEFESIYFIEAIKCGRYKYAYSKLSYELKSDINIDILSQYFGKFDNYIYLTEQDVYITLYNHKITGIHHITVKDNMIDNIY